MFLAKAVSKCLRKEKCDSSTILGERSIACLSKILVVSDAIFFLKIESALSIRMKISISDSLWKSALALDIARRVALQERVPVGFFSLEMSKDQLIDRMIAAQGNVDSWRLRTGKLSSQGDDNDFIPIHEALGVFS